MKLSLYRLLLKFSYHLPSPRLTDWLWHRKMDAFYERWPVEWIHDSGGKFPVIDSMRAW